MTPSDPLLLQELRRDEGVRYVPYLDSVGIKTVGVGHNLEAHPLDLTYPLTDEQVDQILADDLVRVFSGLDRKIGWWRNLSCARMRVLANMAFNLGVDGLLEFKRMILAVDRGHYDQAAREMLNSKWARQVFNRAIRLAEMMANG